MYRRFRACVPLERGRESFNFHVKNMDSNAARSLPDLVRCINFTEGRGGYGGTHSK